MTDDEIRELYGRIARICERDDTRTARAGDVADFREVCGILSALSSLPAARVFEACAEL